MTKVSFVTMRILELLVPRSLVVIYSKDVGAIGITKVGFVTMGILELSISRRLVVLH